MTFGSGGIILTVSIVVAVGTTRCLVTLLKRAGVLDLPNARSSHEVPTPRGGGIAILCGLGAGLLVGSLMHLQLPRWEIVAAASLVAGVGAIDDFTRGVGVLVRLACQSAAAGFVVYRTGGLLRFPLPEPLNIPLGALSIPVAVIWLLAVANIYNFLDGIDGYAAFQGVVTGIGVAVIGEHGMLTVAGLAIAGACGGFLVFNWRPARVFMGDVGSATLGFVFAALPFALEPQVRSRVVLMVALCLWFFLSDGAFTIARRAVQGERVWRAHRSHLYQRLVAAGIKQEEVVLRVGGAGVCLAALTAIATKANRPAWDWLLLGLASACFGVYVIWTRRKERDMEPGKSGEVHWL